MKKNYLLFSILLLVGCKTKMKVPRTFSDEKTAIFNTYAVPVFGHDSVFTVMRSADVDTVFHGGDSLLIRQLWNDKGVEFMTQPHVKVKVHEIMVLQDSFSQKKYKFARFSTKFYPQGKDSLYIDVRFLDFVTPSRENKYKPNVTRAIIELKRQVIMGTPYCWGGNTYHQFDYSKYYGDIGIDGVSRGLDCSGLYDHVLNKPVRHNSGDWLDEELGQRIYINFVPKDSLNATVQEPVSMRCIQEHLYYMTKDTEKAIFLIAWRGHVIGIIKEQNNWFTIESTYDKKLGPGVVKYSLDSRLQYLEKVQEKSFTNFAPTKKDFGIILVMKSEEKKKSYKH